jgi:DNA polymerase-3 subunit gamma/tau
MADVHETPGLLGFNEPDRGYRVLARKYRPRSFVDLIGQDAMVRTISNAFRSGRVPQAWMLTGVRGVGKTTTARILARALNYEPSPGIGSPTVDLAALGVHCQAIMEGRHVDVLEMDAASHTSINDIREITDAARYKPMSARYKVYIIDEVHMLSTAAFNGLLKTLEEPPEHVKFVFATTEIRKVPVTVLSRCQRFDLRRIDGALLARHVAMIAEKEGLTLPLDAAALIARAAEGSVRDALSLLDQAIAHAAGTITVESVRDMLGLVDRLRVYDLLETVMSGNAAAALAGFAAQYADGADPATIVAEMAEAVHAITRAKVAPEAANDIGAPQSENERVAALAARLSLRVLARAWQLLLKGLPEVQSAPRPVAAAEMLLVRLCHAADLPTPDELVRRLADPEQASASAAQAPRASTAPVANASSNTAVTSTTRLAARSSVGDGPARALATPAPANAAVPRVDIGRFEDLVTLAQVKRDIALKVALERSVHLVRFEQGHIEFRLAQGADTRLVADLQKKLAEWTGERWMVVLSQEAGEPTLQQQAEARQRSLKDDVRADPAVAAVLAAFPGAEIVAVRATAGDVTESGAAEDEPLPIEAHDDDI